MHGCVVRVRQSSDFADPGNLRSWQLPADAQLYRRACPGARSPPATALPAGPPQLASGRVHAAFTC
jgi:hypothetical protein